MTPEQQKALSFFQEIARQQVASGAKLTPKQQQMGRNLGALPQQQAAKAAPTKVQQMQSADFNNADSQYAGMSLAEEAEARGMNKAGVRRQRRLEQNERNVSAVDSDQGLVDYINQTVGATGITKNATGGRTKSLQREKKGDQSAAVTTYADANDIPLLYKEDGKIYAMNTGFGAHNSNDLYRGGYELDGSNQDVGAGEYFRFREKKENFGPGDFIKAATTTALAAGGGMALAGALAPTIGAGSIASGAAKGLGSGLVSGTINDNLSTEGLLKSAALGGIAGGDLIGKIPGLGDAYQAQNFGGAFIRGGVNDVIKQGIMDGKIDFGDALKAGLIQSGMETGKDLWGDVRQTNDGNLLEGVDTVNGVPMTAEDIKRLTNTSDLYGLLGENGFLGKMGLDPGYLPTGYLGDSLDFLGKATGGYLDFSGRPIENNPIEKAKEAQAKIDALPDDMPLAEKAEWIKQYENDFYRDTARYDERFFDLTTERGDGAPLTGIWEKNPYGSNEKWFDFSGDGETGTTPSAPTGSTPSTGIGEAPKLPPTNSTPISDNIFNLAPTVPEEDFVSEEEILQGVPPDPAEPMDPNPPEMGTDPTEELPGVEQPPVEELPTEELPGVAPPPVYVDPEQEELPPTAPPPVTIGPGSPGAEDKSQQRAAQFLNEIDDKLFRLARVMSIGGISEKQKMGAAVAMRELLRQKASAVTGDVTAQVDPESGEIITGYVPEGGKEGLLSKTKRGKSQRRGLSPKEKAEKAYGKGG